MIKNMFQKLKKCIVETVDQYTLPGFEGEDIELSINPQIFWELLKCMISSKTISYSSYLKKKNQSLEIEYEKKLHTLQLSYESNPSEALGNKIKQIKQTEDDLKMFRETKVNGIMARAKARWAAEGEKCTNYFCNLEKRHFNEKIITKLIEENGEEIVDQFIILEKQNHFMKIYAPPRIQSLIMSMKNFFLIERILL